MAVIDPFLQLLHHIQQQLDIISADRLGKSVPGVISDRHSPLLMLDCRLSTDMLVEILCKTTSSILLSQIVNPENVTEKSSQNQTERNEYEKRAVLYGRNFISKVKGLNSF